jgi:hypothetical protein
MMSALGTVLLSASSREHVSLVAQLAHIGQIEESLCERLEAFLRSTLERDCSALSLWRLCDRAHSPMCTTVIVDDSLQTGDVVVIDVGQSPSSSRASRPSGVEGFGELISRLSGRGWASDYSGNLETSYLATSVHASLSDGREI